MKPLYTAQVAVTSGRDGSARSSDGKLSVKLAFPTALGGPGDATNPEQLFVAGYAACFAQSIRGVAAAQGVVVRDIRIDAEGVLAVRDDGSYLIPSVKLRVHAPALGTAADAVIAEARRVCAYSNATSGNVQTEVELA
jgi:Ohr subfamily peroxiredoxin